jgi:hypothetical protein
MIEMAIDLIIIVGSCLERMLEAGVQAPSVKKTKLDHLLFGIQLRTQNSVLSSVHRCLLTK